MELVLGIVALGAGVVLFLGANLVALLLMMGGDRPDPAMRERHR